MGRPRTALGTTAGEPKVVGQVQVDGRWVSAPVGTKPGRYRARVKFRDTDGVLRDVERFDSTKAKALTKLKAHLVDRVAPHKGSTLRPETTVEQAGLLWLEQVRRQDGKLSDNSRKQYEGSFGRYVQGSTLANLTLREANRVPVLRAYLQGVADERGSGSAKTARSIVSNIIGLAVEDGVLPANAMRDVRPVRAAVARQAVRDVKRALTWEERAHLLGVADEHERARALDVTDVIWFMAGTGVRISEALAQHWSDVTLDAEAAQGAALVRGTKTAAALREVPLPSWLVARLVERAMLNGPSGLVFPSPRKLDREVPRDRRNVAKVMREVLDEAGFPWATPHTLRRTVASIIDAKGGSIALAADVLGHADPSMTSRNYLGRRGSTAAAAAML